MIRAHTLPAIVLPLLCLLTACPPAATSDGDGVVAGEGEGEPGGEGEGEPGGEGEGEPGGEGEGEPGEGEGEPGGEGEGEPVGEGEGEPVGEGEGEPVGEGEGEEPPPVSDQGRCGDGFCSRGVEDCQNCSGDCGACRNNCGRGGCNGGKDCINCPQDCGVCALPVCGDGQCTGESCSSCAADCGVCPPLCGDGTCNGAETCATCAGDCGACQCGDGLCVGESCSTCSADCGACPPSVCGDLVCQAGESCSLCPSDCGRCAASTTTCVADGDCNGEAGTETCVSCPADCNTALVQCGNGACETAGGESSSTCPMDCGPATWPSDWLAFEAEVVRLMNEHRVAGTDCPSGAKAPVPPFSVDVLLQRASELHAWDMSLAAYFSHTSCNGRQFTDRARAQGTATSAENIAFGQTTPAAAVQAWMSSTAGHCDAIMSTRTIVGIGYARVGNHSWVANFR